MSLDQLFKHNKQKQEATDTNDSGDFRSRSEEENATAALSNEGVSKPRKSGKRSESSRKNTADDVAALPEKKRARRRLIGAVALVLAAVIGLPMVFDSEPKSSTAKIAIEIPSKDLPVSTAPDTRPAYVAPSLTSDAAPANSAEKVLDKSLDKAEEILPAGTPIKEKLALVDKKNEPAAATKSSAVVAATTAAVTTAMLPSKTSTPIVPNTSNKLSAESAKQAVVNLEPKVKASSKVETKLEPKLDTKPSAKKDNTDDAERALALLEGRAVPSKEVHETPVVKNDKSGASFSVQVAALNSPAKVRELQNKLKAANIKSYTQKIITKTGEVSRIRVGPFASKAEAEKTRLKLVKLGLNGSLVPN